MPEALRDRRCTAPYVGAFLFIASFALYLFTLAPTVTFWDSGELIAASWQMGISHQPGYPLFAVMGRLFSSLPFGSVAYRYNILSAFFSSLTVAVLYLAIREAAGEGAGDFLPAAVALTLAPMRVFWSEAVITEVYALSSFFIVLLALLYIKAAKGVLDGRRYILASGFLSGLAIINHEAAVLYLPALALTWLLVPIEGGRERLKAAAAGIAMMLFGLSVLMYLPLRSAAGPWVNIGHPDNLARFWWTVKWGEYLREAPALPSRASWVAGQAVHTGPMLMIVLTLAVFTVWRLWKMSWRLYLPLMAFTVIYLMFISFQVLGGAADEKFGLSGKFFAPALIMGLLFMGALAGDMFRGRAAKGALAVAFLVLAVFLAARNRTQSDASRNFIAFDYAQNSLKSVATGGVLFTWGDNGAFPLWYVQQVERYRDDATIIHAPLLTYDWYLKDVEKDLKTDVDFMDPYFLGENVYRIFKAVTPGRMVAYDYSSTRFLALDPTDLKQRGLVFYEGPAPDGDFWQYYVFRGVDDPTVFKGGMEKNIIQIYNFMKEQKQ